jgi:RNA polymerase sigma factor for flagellar operon FliA
MSAITQRLKKLKDYRNTIDPKVKDEIIVEYAPLVKFIAQKIASRLPSNIELDDLISCGVIGLMDAIEKFDPTRDNKFKTYAEFRIRGSILDELRAQDWVPRSVREKAKTLERAYSKLEGQFGRPATDEEMCVELECSLEEFYELLNKAKSVSLLNIDDSASFNKGDKKLFMNLMENRRGLNPYSAVSYKNLQVKIKDGIKQLPEKQRLVLSLYYFEDLNLKEIGMVLDVTESRVSQLHTQAIIRLKSKLKVEIDSIDDVME